ncbi:MAG: FkbM family methyltransferase [Elainellaceae cyanobacterium]
MTTAPWTAHVSRRWFNPQAWHLRWHKLLAMGQGGGQYLPVQALGQSLRLPKAAHRQFWQGPHADERSLSFLADALPSQGVFFDIGTNIGVYSTALSLAKGRELTVQAFEPIPSTIEVLKETLSLNQVTAHIEAIALSDHVHTLTLSAYDNGANNFWVTDAQADIPTLSVSAVPLDEWMLHHDRIPDAMKIDVEGHELAVLQGAQATIQAYKPALLIECHCGAWESLGVSRQAMVELIESFGYAQVGDRWGRPVDLLTQPSTIHLLCSD